MSFRNKYKQTYDVIAMICAIINSFFIPLEFNFAFKIFETYSYAIWDNAIDLLFFIDIILTFFTSYINEIGQEITQPSSIAKDYIFSKGFVADFLSVLGAGVITQRFPNLKWLGLLKMLRVRRIGKFINRMNFDFWTKSLVSMAKITFYLFIYLHGQACLWAWMTQINGYVRFEKDENGQDTTKIKYTSEDNQLWYTPTDWLDFTSTKLYSD